MLGVHRASFLFIAESYSTVWVSCLFIPFSSGWTFGLFHFWTISLNAAVNFYVQLCVWYCVFIPLGSEIGVELQVQNTHSWLPWSLGFAFPSLSLTWSQAHLDPGWAHGRHCSLNLFLHSAARGWAGGAACSESPCCLSFWLWVGRVQRGGT